MEIRGASITFGEFIDKPGPLPANADSVTYAALKKIANSATVSWTRKDGLRRERTVAVKAPAPSRDHIRFWFVIDDNDAVTFRVEELKDRPQ